jgi:hypothetical protein
MDPDLSKKQSTDPRQTSPPNTNLMQDWKRLEKKSTSDQRKVGRLQRFDPKKKVQGNRQERKTNLTLKMGFVPCYE